MHREGATPDPHADAAVTVVDRAAPPVGRLACRARAGPDPVDGIIHTAAGRGPSSEPAGAYRTAVADSFRRRS